MRSYHYGMIIALLVAGYLACVYFPGPGQKFRSVIGM